MTSQHSLITVPVTDTPKNIVHRICKTIKENNITLYALIDHQADMKARRVFSYPAYTIIFGNPKMGSKLLEKLPVITIDLPLRIAVIKSETMTGSTVIFRNMELLFQDYIEKNEEIRSLALEINSILTRLIAQSIQNETEE